MLRQNSILPLIIVFGILQVAACRQSDSSQPRIANKSSSASANFELPRKKSELNGWQGIRIRKRGPESCELAFPVNYGLGNRLQLRSLRELVNADFEHDLDCELQVKSDALDQIKSLAIEKGDKDASLMLLDPDSFGGFNLDGELAEEYAGTYQLSVLQHSKGVTVLLNNNKVASELSDSLCSWAEVSAEESETVQLRHLVQRLQKEGAKRFADMLVAKCGKTFQ